MKRLLALLSILLLAACGDSDPPTIPLVVYDGQDDYMQTFAQQIESAASEAFVIELYDSQNSQVIQNEIIETIFANNPPLIIINTVDRVGAYTIIEKAKQEEVPLIFINREPLKEDLQRYKNAYYIGADAHESAELQAQMIIEHFGEIAENRQIRTAILMGQQGHQDAEIRTRHVIDTLEANDFPIDLLDIKVANFSQTQAYQQTLNLIDTYGDTIELIIANNDAMAIGAINALINEGLMPPFNEYQPIDPETDPWLPVVGIDALPFSYQYLRSNHYYGTVLQDSATMAVAISEMTTLLLQEGHLENYSFPIEDGHYTWIPYKEFSLDE